MYVILCFLYQKELRLRASDLQYSQHINKEVAPYELERKNVGIKKLWYRLIKNFINDVYMCFACIESWRNYLC